MPAINKLVVFGLHRSGMTQLVHALLNKPFDENPQPTLLAEYSTFDTKEADNDNSITHQVWDVSGDDKYDSVTPMYFRGAQVVVFCVDLSQPLDKSEIQKKISIIHPILPETVSLIIVGTKSDLVKEPQLILDNLPIDDLFHGSKPKRIVTSAKHRTGLDNFRRCIHDAVPKQHLQRSRFEEAESELISQIDRLPKHNQNTILTQLLILKNALLSDCTLEQKTEAIKQFTTNCHTANTKVWKAMLTLAAVATVTLLAGVIGFGIGLIAGAWLGPAAFLTALATGSAAAVAVVSVSTSLGLISGGITFFKSGSTAREQTKELDKFVDKVRPQT